LLCCECDTTFHRACLNTVVETVENGQRWVCDGCRSNQTAEPTPPEKIQDSPEEIKKTITTPSFPSVPNLGPWIFGTRQLELKGPPFQLDQIPVPDPNIPDAAVWTPQDVQDYFSKIGFEEQAALLRQHVTISYFNRFEWLFFKFSCDQTNPIFFFTFLSLHDYYPSNVLNWL